MPKIKTRDSYAVLFYIPSCYGAFSWGVWLLLYLLKLIRLDEVTPLALAVFVVMELLFILSACLTFPYYRGVLNGLNAATGRSELSGYFGKSLLIVLHGLGLAGLMLYLADIVNYFGGISHFFFALLHEAASIRGDANLPSSAGTQLSYFGWLAIGFTIFGVAEKRLSRWWLLLAGIQLTGNLLYIDRTRPIWILFTALIMVLPAKKHLEVRKILKWMAMTLVVFIALFWIGAEWTGKTYYENKFDDPAIPGITQVIYAYGVSGFAYFNHMMVNNEPVSYKPERIVYPVLKFLSKLGLAAEPPSPVLEFYDVPFETNVGTFLEPFYRDGGFLFVLFGALIYSIGFDVLALKFLESNDLFAFFGWSNLCFTSFIAFFTPKVTQFPIWLFIGLSLASLFVRWLHLNIIACFGNKIG